MDDIDIKIIEYKKQNKSPLQIAKILGINKKEIVSRLRKMKEQGVEIPGIAKSPIKTENDEIDNKILKGLEAGKTQLKIAEEIGLSKWTITIRIQQMRARGVKMPEKHKKIQAEAHTTSEFASITRNERISGINQVAQDATTGKETKEHLQKSSEEKTRM